MLLRANTIAIKTELGVITCYCIEKAEAKRKKLSNLLTMTYFHLNPHGAGHQNEA